MKMKLLSTSMFISVLGAFSGCGSHLDIPVADAALGDVDWYGVGAIVGVFSASGTLFVTDTDGEEHELPMTITGPSVGLVFDFFVSDDSGCLLDDRAVLDLSGADGDLAVRDLGGSYVGVTLAGHFGLGGSDHKLANTANGITIHGSGTQVGLGLWMGLDWMGMSIDE